MVDHQTRRKFITQVGLLGAGMLAHSSLACRPGMNQTTWDKNKLGIALVGLGNYSTNLLAPALQDTAHCELRGIVTGTPSKISDWQTRYGIPDANVFSYENMHQIANNDDIDVVYIVVPTALHSRYAVIAAAAGKHVWCEKPMAYSEEQCREIISVCEVNRVRLSIGYRMLHEPNTIRFNEYSSSKPFGDIVGIEANAGYRGGGGSGWRFQKHMGGGAMYDMGVYTVNGIRHALDREPIAVRSARHIINRPNLFKEVDETTEYTLEFKDGFTAKGWTSVGHNKNFMQIDCEEGWYKLQPMQSYSGVTGSTSAGDSWPPIKRMQQSIQMDDDALAIKNNQAFLAPGEDGLRDVRIIEAIFKSAESGNSVDLV